ncbi:MAG TPA: hypothetical protein VHX88_09250 [Solirubrobacteraceae bacterium]|nr:hypothetical protein [Solirubrobacteraceae bacterium]
MAERAERRTLDRRLRIDGHGPAAPCLATMRALFDGEHPRFVRNLDGKTVPNKPIAPLPTGARTALAPTRHAKGYAVTRILDGRERVFLDDYGPIDYCCQRR